MKTDKSLLEEFHFKRGRLTKLFAQAAKHPLVTVCAGAGYGKTRAVHDFTEEEKKLTIWIQLSQRDNIGARFWENCANTVFKLNAPLAEEAIKLGFPDTTEKIKRFQNLLNGHIAKKERLLVLDDFHNIKNPQVINFIEECVLNNLPAGTSVFLLSRTSPEINIASFVSRDFLVSVNENDLRFTENELAQYFKSLNISPGQEALREIMQDTGGWAFAISLIAHSYQKAPGYSGYVRNAMKINIFKLMETEIYNRLSQSLQVFLIRLSLIEHLSIDLIEELALNNPGLIEELEGQTEYIRRDHYINAYVIHPLFREFLSGKQDLLEQEQKNETYALAGNWCNKNGFKIDALSYFEKIEDYSSIVSIFDLLPMEIPYEIAKYAAEIFDRTPVKAFKTTEGLTVLHIRSYICQGLWEKAVELIKSYEAVFLKMPKRDSFRNDTLAILYFSWGTIRKLICVTDDVFDFDAYYEKFCKSAAKSVFTEYALHFPGPWTNTCGSSKKGEPQRFIDCLERSLDLIKNRFKGFTTGEAELAKGELFFYQGDHACARQFFDSAMKLAKTYRQFEVAHRALVYIRRINIAMGNYKAAQNALAEIKALTDEEQYSHRYINYELDLSWYYCILGLPENIPDWLKSGFTPYKYAGFLENYKNQIKTWYFYTTRDYTQLLIYIKEMKNRESFLYGRIEILAMEACVYYQMKDRKSALCCLQEAYKNAFPNDIVIPFIELGKDMRTLTSYVLKEKTAIPKQWLENINKKSASYAKRLAYIATEYKKDHGITDIGVSPREMDILKDLSHGLSRTEIAANRGLSVNTVKMIINNLYTKLGAENLAGMIKIAAERKII